MIDLEVTWPDVWHVRETSGRCGPLSVSFYNTKSYIQTARQASLFETGLASGEPPILPSEQVAAMQNITTMPICKLFDIPHIHYFAQDVLVTMKWVEKSAESLVEWGMMHLNSKPSSSILGIIVLQLDLQEVLKILKSWLADIDSLALTYPGEGQS